ncbi:MAG TPA: hypothetical protein VND65_17680 [Candidatus Binatia bacterium]|nr:hypothetical protein [Candidatus Binatia bacterium]
MNEAISDYDCIGLKAILSQSGSSMSKMLDILSSVAQQLMDSNDVELEGKRLRVKRTGTARLRVVEFQVDGRRLEAIEQNPDKPSHWGKLAREKHQVVQFIDAETHRYVAVSVDGKAREYSD